MLRVCILDMKGTWDKHLLLIEFVYINSYQASMRMVPYEALYDRRCRSPIYWIDVGKWRLLGPKLMQQAVKKI